MDYGQLTLEQLCGKLLNLGYLFHHTPNKEELHKQVEEIKRELNKRIET
ncbi:MULTISPECIES: hypothetical protein [Bacillus cereus group]|nr:hypothetical protein [Bacillus cereus group sp. TH152-1LC]MDA1675234.1 hypothetical protein [Bacillus cereus group sp. TH152-1LC]